jgi:hypothetical protein
MNKGKGLKGKVKVEGKERERKVRESGKLGRKPVFM